ncbi:hypothetical protein [Dyadobacter sp. 32]|jgi:hypothetical protein|uniref:hypothetical protein n=1 Tax=Dyadobacter sp. 32 TaxID=538966 RepID=UPI0011EC7F75
MAHTFEVPFEGEAKDIISKAKTAIEKVEGSFKGDLTEGEFLVPAKVGDVEGTYVVNQQNFVVTIHKKPFIAPYSMIEDALRKYLS